MFASARAGLSDRPDPAPAAVDAPDDRPPGPGDLIEHAPVLIWKSDGSGLLEVVNQEFSVFTGRAASTLRRRRLHDLLHPDDVCRSRALFDPAPAAGVRRETMVRLVTAQGTYRWVKMVASGEENGDIVGSMMDIDSQMNAERELRLADRRKNEFLAMLGHELRNPLMPIINAAEILKLVGGTDGRIDRVRDTLIRQVAHFSRLADDLSDVSRITRGILLVQRTPLDVRELIGRFFHSPMPLMQRKRQMFELNLPAQPLWVEGDAVRLTQVLENLLTNAAKYTPDSGRIGMELDRDHGHAVIRVCDNGLGIEEPMLTRMFDLFEQDPRSIGSAQDGLGIGLALVRHLVELHGGEVRAESEGPGLGSLITVRLPLIAPLASGEERGSVDHENGQCH